MNKDELIDAIAAETEATKIDTRKFLDAYIKATSDALSKGETIQLIGFASFSVAERAARIGRNPQTGKELKIPASKVVKFSSGKALKESVNSGKVANDAKSDKAPAKKPAVKKK